MENNNKYLYFTILKCEQQRGSLELVANRLKWIVKSIDNYNWTIRETNLEEDIISRDRCQAMLNKMVVDLVVRIYAEQDK